MGVNTVGRTRHGAKPNKRHAKVELAIGRILVTIEHERSDTRLKYRDLLVLQNC